MVAAPVAEAASSRPVGFWRRAVALLVDLLAVVLLVHLGDMAAALLARSDLLARAFSLAYRLVVPAAYFVLMQGTEGWTLGKRLVGACIVRATGAEDAPIGYLCALCRLAALCLSGLLLGLGFVAVAVRRDKRALHDLIAGTRVIRLR